MGIILPGEAGSRTVQIAKNLNGEVALWVEGPDGRAVMRPSEVFQLAKVLLQQIGMELPDVEWLR